MVWRRPTRRQRTEEGFELAGVHFAGGVDPRCLTRCGGRCSGDLAVAVGGVSGDVGAHGGGGGSPEKSRRCDVVCMCS
jgi:hypothetical protein